MICPACNSNNLFEPIVSMWVSEAKNIAKLYSVAGAPSAVFKMVNAFMRMQDDNLLLSDIVWKCGECEQFFLRCPGCSRLLCMGKSLPSIEAGEIYFCKKCRKNVIYHERPSDDDYGDPDDGTGWYDIIVP